ncbi:MAG: AI-2E family transporter [Nanoarchaeota archaeon]
MRDPYFKKIMTTITLAVLVVLSFFMLKPIILPIIVGFILAFAFTPLFDKINKVIKSKNFVSFLLCFLVILIIILPLWFLMPILIDQSIKFYVASQNIDFVTPLKNIFPSLFVSEEFSIEVASVLQSFVANVTNSIMNSFSNLLLSFPTLFLQIAVVFFTFFFALRDKEKLISYIQSLLPFSKDIERKLFRSSQNITSSVIYGQIIIGIIQGVFAGLGFVIFGVPNAMLLTLFSALAGIIPIIGPVIIWVPVAVYLFISGEIVPAIGVTTFGILASTIDNLLRPLFVSKRTTMHPALVIIGMIGGALFFGVLGFILGPLIIAYLLIILEIYRDRRTPQILLQEPKNKKI